ncbi:ribosome maturation factor RimP [Caviibacter abscessus]|uniref:ribosome maturation factor RimP n=1 Tax=Caviibacter abscessus TaxID=1766719 RepID=UPI00082D0E55|nr:ribosome maturation factor RimP [Caviibacter abscessus]
MEEKLVELEEQFQKIIGDLDIEVVDVEYVKDGGYNYLRVYIEKNDGSISLDDCEKVSVLISNIAESTIENEFVLEVSSPGLDRKLKKEKDFIRFSGNKITVKTKSNVMDKKSFIGVLLGYENGDIIINDEILGEIKIPHSKLKNARIIYEFKNIKEMEV